MINSNQGPELRAFADIMQGDNAHVMLALSNLVSICQDDIPAPLRLSLIAALRERHTTMPAGREVSLTMQTCLERALIQARLHLMRTPGAAESFRVATSRYATELETRRALVQQHLDAISVDAISALGAIEWCERLVTKFTTQEIARPDLPIYGRQIGIIRDRIIRFDATVGEMLVSVVALLSLGNDVSSKAIDRVRQNLPDFALTMPEIEPVQLYRTSAT